MPLPASPIERKLIHSRTIVCTGHERDDGLWDIEGVVTDVKAQTHVYDIAVRLTIDPALTIKSAAAAVDAAPSSTCASVAAEFKNLAGISLARGFKKAVAERVANADDCPHLMDLLGPVATTAYQAAAFKLRRLAVAKGEPQPRPPFLGTCHTWALDGPIVKREFPAFYTGK